MTNEHKLKTIEKYHINLGDSSINNMNFAISKRYKCDSMYNDIAKYYSSCKVCQN